MADDSMALLDTLRKATESGDVDILREGVRILAQAVMEADVSGLTGLPKGERDPEHRLTHRNGYRDPGSPRPTRTARRIAEIAANHVMRHTVTSRRVRAEGPEGPGLGGPGPSMAQRAARSRPRRSIPCRRALMPMPWVRQPAGTARARRPTRPAGFATGERWPRACSAR